MNKIDTIQYFKSSNTLVGSCIDLQTVSILFFRSIPQIQTQYEKRGQGHTGAWQVIVFFYRHGLPWTNQVREHHCGKNLPLQIISSDGGIQLRYCSRGHR